MNFKKSKNTQMLKDIQEKSRQQSNGLIAINIPLDEIDENPDNAAIFNMDKIDGLAKSIEADGFMGAINVFKKPDGRYEISSGHRRYRAMQLLKRDSIPCIVSEMPDDFDRALKLLSSNIRNRDMGPMDWARTIKYYQDIRRKQKEQGLPDAYKGSLRKDVAEYFGMSEGQVSRYEALNKLIPDLQVMANNPVYPWNAIARASILSTDEQKELYETLQESLRLARERDRNMPLIDVAEDLPFAKDKDQKENDIAQNTISGQRILLEIKRIQNRNAEKFKKERQEAQRDIVDLTSNNLADSYLEESDAEEMQSDYTPGQVSLDVEGDPFENRKAIEPEDDHLSFASLDDAFDELDGIGVNEEPLVTEEENGFIDNSIEQSTEKLVRVASDGAMIKDKVKLKEYIKKLENVISILKKLL